MHAPATGKTVMISAAVMVVEMRQVWWIVLESGSTTSSGSSKRPRIDQLPAANLDADDPLDDDVSVYHCVGCLEYS